MTSEHSPARSARPEVDPRDAPDALHPDDPRHDPPAEQEPEEQVPDDRGRETPRPQPSPGS